MKYEVIIDDFTAYVTAGNCYQAGLLALDEFIESRCRVPNCSFIVQNLENNQEEIIPFSLLLAIRVESANFDPTELEFA